MSVRGGSRYPCTGLALAAMAGVALADPVALPVAAVGLVLAGSAVATLWRGGTAWTLCCVASAFALVHTLHWHHSPSRTLGARLGTGPVAIELRGTARGDVRIAKDGCARFALRVRTARWANGVWRGGMPPLVAVVAPRGAAPSPGDRLWCVGSARRIEGARNPGEWDRARFFHRRDIWIEVRVDHRRDLSVEGAAPARRALGRVRRWMEDVLGADLESERETAGLIAAVVLGAQDRVEAEWMETFRAVGAAHLFSVSGLHVGMVAAILWFLARACRLRSIWALGFVVGPVFLYAAITGAAAPSVRAAVMAAVVLGGMVGERPGLMLNSLGAAAVLVVGADTNQPFTAGFQLSFGIVAALALLVPPLRVRFRALTAPDPFLPRSLVPRGRRALQGSLEWFADSLAVSVAAWLGSFPLGIAHFHLVTPVSVAANLLLVPLTFLMMTASFGALAAVWMCPPLAWAFNNANWALARLLLAGATLFARVPGGHFHVGGPPLDPGEAEFTALSLERGGALCARVGERVWMFNSGGASDYERVVKPFLRARGVDRLSGYVAAQPGAAHNGAVGRLLAEFDPVRVCAPPPVKPRGPPWREEARVPVETWAAGARIDLGCGIVAEVFHPPAGLRRRSQEDGGLVVRLECGPWRLLYAPAPGFYVQHSAIESGADLSCHALVRGEHGVDNIELPGFSRATAPLIVLVHPNAFGAAHPAPLGAGADPRAGAAGECWRLDASGAVVMHLSGRAFRARAFRSGQAFSIWMR